MNPSDIPVAQLVPHAGNMVLISQLLAADDQSAEAIVIVANNGLFCGDQNQVPAWVGIEYMAQTIAAWAGYHAYRLNEPVKMGFLIGTRRYSSNVNHFNCNDTLTVRIDKNFGEDSGLGSFNCVISGHNVNIVSSLNVFQPNDEQIKELMESRNE
jgi:predicted hotdog family 3-hydroxylacyl-ACP dehydratase